MKHSELYRRVVNYLGREADQKTLEELEVELENDSTVRDFQLLVKIDYLIAYSMGDYDVQKAKRIVRNKMKKHTRQKRLKRVRRISLAACILLLAGLSSWLYFSSNEVDNSEQIHKITSGTQKAILTLDNGSQLVLQKGKKQASEDFKSDGSSLFYENTREDHDPKIQSGTVRYHHLTVPRGGQFLLELSDGTRIWLNSDSQLKYPSRFTLGEKREVDLIYGEAYFEVSSAEEQGYGAFRVSVAGQEVNVMGTEFNIKAYQDDPDIRTSLIGGSILLKKGAEEQMLSPNQQAITYPSKSGINLYDIDASREISWVKGLFDFNEQSLQEVLKLLARWYNVEIIYGTEKHDDYVFTGILERSSDIREVLAIIKATSVGEINFIIHDRTIIVE